MARLNMRKFDEQTKRLIQFADEAGWEVSLTNNNHLRFDKSGRSTVYFSGTPGGHRAALNAKSKLRHADQMTGRYANA